MNSQLNEQQKKEIDINDYTYVKQFDRPMYERLYDYQKETKVKQDYNFDVQKGVLIGHSMGLGKTPISCSLLQLFFSNKLIRYAIIVVPKSLLEQWSVELPKWCNVSVFKYVENRQHVLEEFLKKQCAILLTTYKIIASDYLILQNTINQALSESRRKATNKNETNQSKTAKLIDSVSLNGINDHDSVDDEYPYRHVPFDIMILEEATFIKNDQTQAYRALSNLDSFFKIALTGTPIMNNLIELYNLVNFLHPGFLGLKADFKQFYANNIENSKIKDATDQAKYCGNILKNNLMTAIQPMLIRYTKEQLKLLDIHKTEIIIWSDLPEVQREIMLGFIKSKQFRRNLHELIKFQNTPFKYIISLRKICDHTLRMYEPDIELIKNEQEFIQFLQAAKLLYQKWCPEIEAIISTQHPEDDTAFQTFDSDTNQSTNPSDSLSHQTQFTSMMDDIQTIQKSYQHILNHEYQKQMDQLQKLDNQIQNMNINEEKIIVDTLNKHMGIKYSILLTLANYFVRNKLKTLIFAEHTTSLDIICFTFKQAGISYFRFDGSITKTSERQSICEKFQESQNTYILMMTSRVGSYGLNLQEAKRVVLFGPSWNKTIEEQAIGRAYRLGQKGNVIVYKLVQRYTIEEKLLARQLHKFQISNVTGDQGAILKAKQKDIKDLFNFSHFEVNTDAQQLKNRIEELRGKQYINKQNNENLQILRYMERILSQMDQETTEETCKRLFGQIDSKLDDIDLIQELQEQFQYANIACTNMRTKVDEQYDNTQGIDSEDSNTIMPSQGYNQAENDNKTRDNAIRYTIVSIQQLREWGKNQQLNGNNYQPIRQEKALAKQTAIISQQAKQNNHSRISNTPISISQDSFLDIFQENSNPLNSIDDTNKNDDSQMQNNKGKNSDLDKLNNQQNSNFQQDILVIDSISISESQNKDYSSISQNNERNNENQDSYIDVIQLFSNDEKQDQQAQNNHRTHSSIDDGSMYVSNDMHQNTLTQQQLIQNNHNSQAGDDSDVYTIS